MRALSFVVGGVVLLTGCAMADNTVGGPVPQQFLSENFPGERRPVQARVHQASNGCFLGSLTGTDEITRYLIVWPVDTAQGADGDELRLPDGTAVHHGDLLTGDGVLMSTSKLENIDIASYWHHTVGYCTPRVPNVLVLDSAVKR